jgi:hypothetical protein
MAFHIRSPNVISSNVFIAAPPFCRIIVATLNPNPNTKNGTFSNNTFPLLPISSNLLSGYQSMSSRIAGKVTT